MKNLFLLSFLLICIMANAQNEWHVVPTGGGTLAVANGGGTIDHPWELQFALNQPTGVLEGDTIWLHGGDDYVGHFTSTLLGTSDRWITVASYPGEWARLDGNIYTYVPPSQSIITSRINGTTTPFENEMDTFIDEEEEADPGILTVAGNFVIYRNFEITCIGDINRLKIINKDTGVNCSPLNGYHSMAGINHSEYETKNKFINLVIRNVPGLGIGSWKYTQDSEIYGCIIYNNGYILNTKNDCSDTGFSVVGKGFGIYTQNMLTTEGFYRTIRNNIIMNNYDSGIGVWSATHAQTLNLLENYNISENILINNGGPQRDESPNVKIASETINNWGHPHNINFDHNICYINSRGDYWSGVWANNSNALNIHDNYFFKGTAGAVLDGNNTNLTFGNNFQWGKQIYVYTSVNGYSSSNWNLHDNAYYRYNDGSLNTHRVMITPPSYVGISLQSFQSTTPPYGYGGENNSVGPLSSDTLYYNYWLLSPTGTDLITFRYPSAPTAFNSKTFITQNKYNPNVFYVVVFDPMVTVASNNTISADFTNYVNNDPSLAGKYYTYRDAEDYFSTNVYEGYLNEQNKIGFPMNNFTNIEAPIGTPDVDYVNSTVHTLKDFHAFVVEFGCEDLHYDITINRIDNGTMPLDRAKNNIFIGTINYVANSDAVVDARAGKQILFRQNAHIKSGADLLAKIETTCADVGYNDNLIAARHSTETPKEEPAESQEAFTIYPNPSFGIFKIESLTNNKIVRVVISKIDNGREVFSCKYKNEQSIDINICKQQAAIYTVQVYFENGNIQTKKIIKK